MMVGRNRNNRTAPDSGVIGVILAGGLSRRMGGGDKCLLPFGEGDLLSHVATRLAPQVGRLLLNANGDPARFDDHAARFDLKIVADSVPGFAGPLAGVLAGLEAAVTLGADAIITVAADTPFFPTDLAAGLADAAERGGLALAASMDATGTLRDHPTFGLWPTALAADLRRALVEEEIRKVVIWTRRHNAALAEFARQPGGDPFFNVNTPGDMSLAEQRLASQCLTMPRSGS